MKIKPSANVQYKGHDSRRSILDFSITGYQDMKSKSVLAKFCKLGKIPAMS